MKECERSQYCEGFMPIDMSGGANTGDWVSLKDWGHLEIVFFKDVGTAAEDPTITVEQATAVAGTSHKALLFTTLYVKQAATNLQAVSTWTKVTQTAATSYTNGTLGEEAAIIVIEFDAEDLDVSGGFDCVQASIADTGTTAGSMGMILYRLSEPRYAQATAPGGITD